MNPKVTDEMNNDACKCNKMKCGDCSIYQKLETDSRCDCIEKLAKALKAERAERKAMHDVWEDAPKWADKTYQVYYNEAGNKTATTKTITRQLPKSKERLIAEKYFMLEESINACEEALLELKAGEK